MYRERFDLTGSTAMITGGGRGIGLASAEALAEHGANIVISDVDAKVLDQGYQKLRDNGINATAVRLDVTKPAEVASVAETLNRTAPVDILIANAGIALPDTPGEHISDADWSRVIDVNLNGVYWCCREFGRAMVERGAGSIVTIGSMSGLISNKPQRQAHYNASKAAVHHLTKSLAGEWAELGVRVNCIAPTYIDTAMSHGGLRDAKLATTWMDYTPMKRAGRADEVAAIALFLASRASSLMTGAIVVADAGYTIW